MLLTVRFVEKICDVAFKVRFVTVRRRKPSLPLGPTNVLYKKQAQIQEEELDNYGDDDLGEGGNEENAVNKCDDYHEDELGLE